VSVAGEVASVMKTLSQGLRAREIATRQRPSGRKFSTAGFAAYAQDL